MRNRPKRVALCRAYGVAVLLTLAALCMGAENDGVPPPPAGYANVIGAARVSAKPEARPETLPILIDGKVGKPAFDFEVGTKGPGAFTFRFRRPHVVTALHFHQSAKIYRAESFKVLADVTGNRKYSKTLATGVCAEPPSWSGAEWKPVKVHGIALVAVKGQSQGRRAYPEVSEIMLYGKPLPTDQEDMRQLGNPVAAIRTVRPIQRDTALTTGGRAPAILVPDTDAFATVAAELETALEKRLGVKPERVHTIEAAQPGKRTIIAMGNMLTNPLITRLYFNGYSFEDSLCPAGEAYVLRVAYNPYPWRGERNVVILGCETAAGGRRAAAEFLGRLEGEGPKASLPYTLVVSEDAVPYTPYAPRSWELMQPLKELPASGVGQPSPVRHFVWCVDAYLRTGKEEAARRAVASIEEIVRWRQQKGDDADLSRAAWPMGWEIFFAWDPFEYNPLLTEKLRHDFVSYLLVGMKQMHKHEAGYPRGKGIGPVWNHLTEPLCGAYAGGRYFHNYYGIAEGKQYMDEARDCFIWQAKSWRSAEDAAGGYLGMATQTCAVWSLAEWQLDYFTSGNALKNAEFYMTICDQAGAAAGFGDGGVGGRSTPNRTLPIAFWYTRDPRILWCLNSWNNGVWPNPYWRNVEPAEPSDILGVKAFPFDRPLYQRTLKLPYYSGMALPKTTVKVDEAFDKLAFKDGWSPNDQFLCLDGFGRGYHLHYDTLAINRLSSDGEWWLFDDDYLERDSGRHTMATLLYNGRCEEVVPAFARLNALGDFPRWGMSSATLPDYNHADWTRGIIWRKGKYFLLIDEFTALDGGEFVFDLGYRLRSWPRYDQRMVGPCEFLAERNLPRRSQYVQEVRDGAAAAGKAVEFQGRKSLLGFGLTLPAGQVRIGVRGQANDAAGSVFVGIGGAQGVAALGNGRYDVQTTPEFTIEKAGQHAVSIWPREPAPFRIDQVIVMTADGRETVLEADALPPPPVTDAVKRFHIKAADNVGMFAYNEWNDRITRNRMYVRQRRSGALAKGETRSFASLLIPAAQGRRGEYSVRRVGRRAFAVSGGEPAFVALGKFKSGPIDADAACIMISPGVIRGVNVTHLRVGAWEWQADTAHAPSAERMIAAAESALAHVAALPEAREDEPGIGGYLAEGIPIAGKPSEPKWKARFPLGAGVMNCLIVTDIDEDGAEEILVSRNNMLYCLDSSGQEKWRFETKNTVNQFAVGRFRRTGRHVVIGGADTWIYLVDGAGRELKRAQYLGNRNERGKPTRAAVLCVAAADFNGDGIDEVVAGGKDWHAHLYDADLNERLKTIYVPHHANEIHCADGDGDGTPEIFIANNYGSVYGFSIGKSLDTQKQVFLRYLSIGKVVCAVGDIDGRKGAEVVMGVTTGDLGAAACDLGYTNYLWRFDNFGYDVGKLLIRDMNGDGAGDAIVSGATGYLFILDGKSTRNATPLMRHRVGRWVKDMAIVTAHDNRPAILAGDANGRLAVVSANGTELFQAQAPSSIRLVGALSGTAGKKTVIAATAGGNLLAYEWPAP